MYSEYCNGSQNKVFNIAKPVCEPDDQGTKKTFVSIFTRDHHYLGKFQIMSVL